MALSSIIHAAGVGVFGYSLYQDIFYVSLPPELEATGKFDALIAFPGKWKFLTVWNLVLQFLYHVISLVNDGVGSSELNVKRQTTLQKFRDTVFASWVFPTGLFVSVSFWTLYAIDRELVFPTEMDIFYPCWLNHATHTGPILFVTAESYFVPKAYPNMALGISSNVFFVTLYSAWIVWVNYYSGVWAYPILEAMDNTSRTVFIALSGGFIFGFYFFGESLNSWRWGIKGDSKGAGGKGKGGAKKRKAK